MMMKYTLSPPRASGALVICRRCGRDVAIHRRCTSTGQMHLEQTRQATTGTCIVSPIQPVAPTPIVSSPASPAPEEREPSKVEIEQSRITFDENSRRGAIFNAEGFARERLEMRMLVDDDGIVSRNSEAEVKRIEKQLRLQQKQGVELLHQHHQHHLQIDSSSLAPSLTRSPQLRDDNVATETADDNSYAGHSADTTMHTDFTASRNNATGREWSGVGGGGGADESMLSALSPGWRRKSGTESKNADRGHEQRRYSVVSLHDGACEHPSHMSLGAAAAAAAAARDDSNITITSTNNNNNNNKRRNFPSNSKHTDIMRSIVLDNNINNSSSNTSGGNHGDANHAGGGVAEGGEVDNSNNNIVSGVVGNKNCATVAELTLALNKLVARNRELEAFLAHCGDEARRGDQLRVELDAARIQIATLDGRLKHERKLASELYEQYTLREQRRKVQQEEERLELLRQVATVQQRRKVLAAAERSLERKRRRGLLAPDADASRSNRNNLNDEGDGNDDDDDCEKDGEDKDAAAAAAAISDDDLLENDIRVRKRLQDQLQEARLELAESIAEAQRLKGELRVYQLQDVSSCIVNDDNNKNNKEEEKDGGGNTDDGCVVADAHRKKAAAEQQQQQQQQQLLLLSVAAASDASSKAQVEHLEDQIRKLQSQVRAADASVQLLSKQNVQLTETMMRMSSPASVMTDSTANTAVASPVDQEREGQTFTAEPSPTSSGTPSRQSSDVSVLGRNSSDNIKSNVVVINNNSSISVETKHTSADGAAAGGAHRNSSSSSSSSPIMPTCSTNPAAAVPQMQQQQQQKQQQQQQQEPREECQTQHDNHNNNNNNNSNNNNDNNDSNAEKVFLLDEHHIDETESKSVTVSGTGSFACNAGSFGSDIAGYRFDHNNNINNGNFSQMKNAPRVVGSMDSTTLDSPTFNSIPTPPFGPTAAAAGAVIIGRATIALGGAATATAARRGAGGVMSSFSLGGAAMAAAGHGSDDAVQRLSISVQSLTPPSSQLVKPEMRSSSIANAEALSGAVYVSESSTTSTSTGGLAAAAAAAVQRTAKEEVNMQQEQERGEGAANDGVAQISEALAAAAQSSSDSGLLPVAAMATLKPKRPRTTATTMPNASEAHSSDNHLSNSNNSNSSTGTNNSTSSTPVYSPPAVSNMKRPTVAYVDGEQVVGGQRKLAGTEFGDDENDDEEDEQENQHQQQQQLRQTASAAAISGCVRFVNSCENSREDDGELIEDEDGRHGRGARKSPAAAFDVHQKLRAAHDEIEVLHKELTHTLALLALSDNIDTSATAATTAATHMSHQPLLTPPTPPAFRQERRPEEEMVAAEDSTRSSAYNKSSSIAHVMASGGALMRSAEPRALRRSTSSRNVLNAASMRLRLLQARSSAESSGYRSPSNESTTEPSPPGTELRRESAHVHRQFQQHEPKQQQQQQQQHQQQQHERTRVIGAGAKGQPVFRLPYTSFTINDRLMIPTSIPMRGSATSVPPSPFAAAASDLPAAVESNNRDDVLPMPAFSLTFNSSSSRSNNVVRPQGVFTYVTVDDAEESRSISNNRSTPRRFSNDSSDTSGDLIKIIQKKSNNSRDDEHTLLSGSSLGGGAGNAGGSLLHSGGSVLVISGVQFLMSEPNMSLDNNCMKDLTPSSSSSVKKMQQQQQAQVSNHHHHQAQQEQSEQKQKQLRDDQLTHPSQQQRERPEQHIIDLPADVNSVEGLIIVAELTRQLSESKAAIRELLEKIATLEERENHLWDKNMQLIDELHKHDQHQQQQHQQNRGPNLSMTSPERLLAAAAAAADASSVSSHCYRSSNVSQQQSQRSLQQSQRHYHHSSLSPAARHNEGDAEDDELEELRRHVWHAVMGRNKHRHHHSHRDLHHRHRHHNPQLYSHHGHQKHIQQQHAADVKKEREEEKEEETNECPLPGAVSG